MDRKSELNLLTTFDLAFNLATGKYNESDKFTALEIIKDRSVDQHTGTPTTNLPKKSKKKPLKGSKAEKILQLYDSGVNSATDIFNALKKKKIKAYYPEIYRVLRKYTDFE
jgi:hypothetical protein